MQQLRELLRQLLAVLSLRSPLKIVLRTRSKDRTAFGVVVRKTRRLDAEIGPPNHALLGRDGRPTAFMSALR
jgi:hypothetical protein